VLPQPQITLISLYSGWMASFMALYLGAGRAEKRGRSVATQLRGRKKKTFAFMGPNGFVGT
jgi:hypothetical protein